MARTSLHCYHEAEQILPTSSSLAATRTLLLLLLLLPSPPQPPSEGLEKEGTMVWGDGGGAITAVPGGV